VCASGEKKLLLLSHADQMADEQVLTTFVTDYDPSYKMATDALLNEKYEPSISYPGVTVYGQTRELKNDDAFKVPIDRYDPFPNAVEMCVPTATIELTMWMHVYSSLGYSDRSLTFSAGNDYDDQGRRRQLLGPPTDGEAPGPATPVTPTLPETSREITPSFTIMDERGCMAVPDTTCVLTSSSAPNYYSACPEGGNLPTATKMTLRASNNAKCLGYWDMNDHVEMNMYPEIAMMEAVEFGFNVPQFSTYITDLPSDEASCPDGTETIYFVVSSPTAGLDTFSYGVKSVTDHGKITKVRNSGGTLISPKRTMIAEGQAYTAKFPVRYDGGVAFDCFSAMGKPQPGPATSATPDTMGIIYYETAYKELFDYTTLEASSIPQTVRASCTYGSDQPSFQVSKMCAAHGEYTLQGTKAESEVRSAGSKVMVTDANGCRLAEAEVPAVATSSTTPSTNIGAFSISATTSTRYFFDNITGIDSCTKLYAPAYATVAPAATAPSKPVCPTGYRLMESVTQTSTNGATNEWYVAHIIYNDTTNETLHAAHTPMRRSRGGKAHAIGLNSWCLLPGNYSLNLWDYSGLSGTELGWKSGGVFLSDANDCKVLHATAQGVGNATSYFTVVAGNDATPAVCPDGVLNKTEGWCTYEVVGELATTCNALDVRAAITTESSTSQTDCHTVWGGVYEAY